VHFADHLGPMVFEFQTIGSAKTMDWRSPTG
jgi:hypothetical protein